MESRSIVGRTVDQICRSWLPDDRLKHGRRVLKDSIELEADRHRAPLFLFLSRVFKIIVFSHREWQYSKQELHARYELLIVDP
jgi:hypothetical protein